MNPRIHFLYQISEFWENGKRILGQATKQKQTNKQTKNNFEIKMLILFKNHDKTKVYEGFSHVLIKALFLKILTKSDNKFSK